MYSEIYKAESQIKALSEDLEEIVKGDEQIIRTILKKILCKHDDLKNIKTIIAYDTTGRLTLHKTKNKCNNCGRIIKKREV